MKYKMSETQFNEFKNKYLNSKRKNAVAIVRNGTFLGLFRYNKQEDCFILFKKLNNDKYGYKEKVYFPDSENGYCKPDWSCNEFVVIPKGYDLRKKQHINILIDAFYERIEGWHSSSGANRSWECVQKYNPNPVIDLWGNKEWSY